MIQYRVPELDLSTRLAIACEMMREAKERGWGRVSELARSYNVSRTLLYKLRDQAWSALERELAPKRPGPQGEVSQVEVNEELIRRAITILPMVQGSVRGIQSGLELLFGVERSVGFIQGTLAEIGAKAAVYNACVRPASPVLGEVDEIFCSGQPCLTVVDGDSFLVLNISAAEARDETTWGLKFLELQEQGIEFADVAADGALGIKAGLAAAQIDAPLRPDLFHLMQDAIKISRRLEQQAYQAMETTATAWRVLDQATAPQPRRGRPHKCSLSWAEAQQQEVQAIESYDNWSWLLRELRQTLEPITPAAQVACPETVRHTLLLITDLMQQLNRRDITDFAIAVRSKLDLFLAPLAALEQTLAPLRIALNTDSEATIIRLWQQKAQHQLTVPQLFSPALQPLARTFWDALDRFHRSSSLAESFHAWLRPFLQLHRSLPPWLAALLQLFWNHHTFQRGKRSGHSPIELASGQQAPALADVIDLLLQS